MNLSKSKLAILLAALITAVVMAFLVINEDRDTKPASSFDCQQNNVGCPAGQENEAVQPVFTAEDSAMLGEECRAFVWKYVKQGDPVPLNVCTIDLAPQSPAQGGYSSENGITPQGMSCSMESCLLAIDRFDFKQYLCGIKFTHPHHRTDGLAYTKEGFQLFRLPTAEGGWSVKC